MIQFSVLMSVYIKESPAFLQKSLASIFNQTLKADEVVLVEDGPLTDELYEVIDLFKKHPTLRIVKLDKNQGLGKALNEGMQFCSFEYIARMDSDDICVPTRFEKQILYLKEHPDIDVVGSWTQEFTEDEKGRIKFSRTKKFPTTVWKNFKYSIYRCPVEHPAVMLRKAAVLSVGGYKEFYLFEDYYLWARMFVYGYKFANIPETLLYFRMTKDSFKRRGGWKYAKSEVQALSEFKKMGFLTKNEYLKNILIRIPVRLIPNALREFVYKTFLRRY